jgi:transcription elongation factor GreB
MSKAFTKDDDAGDAPLLVARRAPLPSAAPNYVTERGLALLRAELAREIDRWAARTEPMSDAERARVGARHAAQVAEIEARIGSAVLVESARQPRDEVRFGAKVRVRNRAGSERTYRIRSVSPVMATIRAAA